MSVERMEDYEGTEARVALSEKQRCPCCDATLRVKIVETRRVTRSGCKETTAREIEALPLQVVTS